MYVQIVEFDVRGVSRDEYEQFCEEAVPAMLERPTRALDDALAAAGVR